MIYDKRKPFNDSGTRLFIVIATSVGYLEPLEARVILNQFKEDVV